MRFLVTGVNGQLGGDVTACLTAQGHACTGVGRSEMNLTDSESIRETVRRCQPEVIIHCAAYTAVDRAESEPETCMLVNAVGTKHLVDAAMETGAALMYISTDYVLSGEGDAPQPVDAPLNPSSIYGLSKLQGEQAVRETMTRAFIVRSEWIFGHRSHNFVKAILDRGAKEKTIDVVADQIGAPTYSLDLAEAICQLAQTAKWGTYHIASEGVCSWAEFAEEILRLTGSDCRVRPVPSESYHTAARRPRNSRLDLSSMDEAGLKRLPDWRDGLRRYLIRENRLKSGF
ncbi:MAG: dTDP-4-dehydrorhamnose reductase [Clostridia bacterium]|nr:dTDP-4-dehydrorhamnose reductase [Clostridia bacterium]